MRVQLTKGSELSDTDTSIIHELVIAGNAVALSTDDLRKCQVLAIARTDEGKIVGIGAVKHKRLRYDQSLSERSGYVIPDNMRELGYFAANPAYGTRLIAKKLLLAILAEYTGDLFFTTSNDRIKSLLVRAGFTRQGQNWEGRSGRDLTLMTRFAPRLTRRKALWKRIQTAFPRLKGVL